MSFRFRNGLCTETRAAMVVCWKFDSPLQKADVPNDLRLLIFCSEEKSLYQPEVLRVHPKLP